MGLRPTNRDEKPAPGEQIANRGRTKGGFFNRADLAKRNGLWIRTPPQLRLVQLRRLRLHQLRLVGRDAKAVTLHNPKWSK